MIQRLKNPNLWIMLVGDAALVLLAYYLAFFIRFEGVISPKETAVFLETVVWILPAKLVLFFFFQFYRGMWRYTSLYELSNILKASLISSVLMMVVILYSSGFMGFSRGLIVIDFMLTTGFLAGSRILIRYRFSVPVQPVNWRVFKQETKNNQRVLILGAGNTGEKLLREIEENPALLYTVVGFVDDARFKLDKTIHGIPVLGNVEELPFIARKCSADKIIIAAPSATSGQMKRIIAECEASGVPFQTVPGIGELIEGKVSVTQLRDVRYEDLLKRDPVCCENELISCYLTAKCVMVTGGSGSIGSELCRQITALEPRKLVIVERNESPLYESVLDLKAVHPELEIVSALGAIQNRERMARVFAAHRPQVVFHAAAYKHVPMMEMHPWEAIFNNVVGSRIILDMCHLYEVERCVVVSTDKAVRPTNIMGATKRFVELLTQSYASLNGVRYMAVRFGNVLGSAGSVLPLFQKQIESGGPVTVTDPRVTRYFMTIPEAVSLILQAGAMGRGGEVFILKMGTPIRIADMARDLINLSGYRPDKDIKIDFIGLRPGEKLFEELMAHGEGIQKTEHDDVMVLGTDSCLPLEEMNRHIDALVEMAKASDAAGIKAKLCEIIPEYCPWKDDADQACPAGIVEEERERVLQLKPAREVG